MSSLTETRSPIAETEAPPQRPMQHAVPPAGSGKPSPKRRYPDIDLFRIFGVLGVVIVHVCSRAQGGLVDGGGLDYWSINTLNAFTRGATALFVMVSGAIILVPTRYPTWQSFYRKRLARLGIPILFWTCLYLALRIAAGHHTDEPSGLGYYFYEILRGEPFWHLHFLFIIGGLYALTPFLHQLFKSLSDKGVLALGFLTLALAIGDAVSLVLIEGEYTATAFGTFAPYFGFFVLGYGISRVQLSRKWLLPVWLVFITGGVITALTNGFYQLRTGDESAFYLYTYPNIALKIVALFALIKLHFRKMSYPTGRAGEWMKQWAAASLGIYLIHPLFLEGIERIGLNFTRSQPLIAVPLTALAVFALSGLATIGIRRIPYVRSIMG